MMKHPIFPLLLAAVSASPVPASALDLARSLAKAGDRPAEIPVTVALASTYMTPLFGVVLAMLLLGERLTATTAIGAILLLGATALVMRSDAARERLAAGGGPAAG